MDVEGKLDESSKKEISIEEKIEMIKNRKIFKEENPEVFNYLRDIYVEKITEYAKGDQEIIDKFI